MNPYPIIGASISGLFAAYHLARRGAPVRVFEAQAPFRPAERTLIVTPAWRQLLDFDPGEAVLHRVSAYELISPAPRPASPCGSRTW
jgi:2-polyprenyl-6-methoxyphenol hydroxylase-like FAD-dependent oxidoreductase